MRWVGAEQPQVREHVRHVDGRVVASNQHGHQEPVRVGRADLLLRMFMAGRYPGHGYLVASDDLLGRVAGSRVTPQVRACALDGEIRDVHSSSIASRRSEGMRAAAYSANSCSRRDVTEARPSQRVLSHCL